ncbi:MAG: DUF1343 domain-containing protein [Planctomycetota bacterium]
MNVCRIAALLLLGVGWLGTATSAVAEVELGVDRLVEADFRGLVGKRVGLVTNHTGVASDGRTTIDILHEAPGVNLVRLFGPEHGLRGELDQSQIDDGVDGPTGLPIVSLYGPRRAPEPEHLADLDVLVFDIQDIGCRFYTYISTMKLAMEAAAKADVGFMVLDRPNPIGGARVEGPMLDAGEESFVGCYALPVRHGMTIGEIASLMSREGVAQGLIYTVVRCEGWRREQAWDETGLVWTNPSPNMRRLTQALLYPGVGMLETTNLSVGRGTDTPFELFGAPWVEPRELAAALNAAQTPGVRFTPRYFTPTSSKFAGERCGGVDVLLLDAEELNAVEVGLTIAATLRRLFPEAWDTSSYGRLLINASVLEALNDGADAERLHTLSRAGVQEFRRRRADALLYR